MPHNEVTPYIAGLPVSSSNPLNVTVPAGATAPSKAEDVASAGGDVGVPAMAIQQSTPADTAGTNGDYAMLQMSAGRLWVSADVPVGATTIAKAEDAAHASGDVGVQMLAVRKATPANVSGTDGDYESLQVDAGSLWTKEAGYSFLHIAAGAAATFVVKASAGKLHSIILNGPATATNVTTIYDHPSSTGTIIGIPAVTAVVAPVTLLYDLAFANGLTIITTVANGASMTVVYQ